MNHASMALLAVFLCIGTLSYAAEHALPGDALYSVKTGFNENIQSLLSFTPESKAKLEASLAEKRIIEAQDLATFDRLSTSTEGEIQQNLTKHIDEFKKSVKELGVEQPATAVTLSSDLQTTLTAQQNVLKNIAAGNASSTDGIAHLDLSSITASSSVVIAASSTTPLDELHASTTLLIDIHIGSTTNATSTDPVIATSTATTTASTTTPSQ